MFKKLTKQESTSFSDMRSKIFIYLLLPSILMITFSHVSQIIYKDIYKNNLKDNYLSFFETFSSNTEMTMNAISHSASMLSDNDTFMRIVTDGSSEPNDIEYLHNITADIKENFDIIDSICVISTHHDIVYNKNSYYNIESFFSNNYIYENYDILQQRINRNPNAEILISNKKSGEYIFPPTNVYISPTTKAIMPMVITKYSNNEMQGVILINLDISKILLQLKKSPLFKYSTPSILNKQTLVNFSPSITISLEENDIISLISQRKSSNFDYEIYNSKCYMVSYFPEFTSDYVYMAAIPYEIINNSIPTITTIMLVIFYMIFILSLLMLFLGTKIIYTPMSKITKLFSIKETDSFDVLYKAISDTLSTNAQFHTQMQHSLPYIKGQQLIQVLNSTDDFLITDNSSLSDLDFPYEYFCSVIIKLNYTNSFYDKYDNITEKTIEIGIYDVIKYEFADKFENFYIVPSDEHTLYILLNLQSHDMKEEIDNVTNDISQSFSYDNDDMNLVISSGSICQGIKGMKQSHNEATEEITKISNSWNYQLKINLLPTKKADMFFTHTEETILYNLLIASNIDKAHSIIENKLLSFYEKERTEYEISQFYSALFNVMFKIMKMRNIQYDNDADGDNVLISKIVKMPSVEIQKILYEYLEILRKNNDNKKIDITTVISYIQDNFNKDIYLEGIAETFNTSTSYLSRLLKKETSSTFSEYLNILRVNKAKELLTNTQLSIKEIYEQVGFNNRNTFIRVFKNFVGVTPSEYRAAQIQ